MVLNCTVKLHGAHDAVIPRIDPLAALSGVSDVPEVRNVKLLILRSYF
jgi:hypothetical protein